MTTNDRLQEAIEKYGTPLSDNRVVVNLDDVPRIAYRAGIDAVQPAPTDADVWMAIEEYGIYKHKLENARDSGPDPFVLETYEPMMNQLGVKVDDARANLLRLIAAQREAAVREALEEHEPSADEIEAGARRLWSELPGEAYRDCELGMVTTDWNDARHESQVTYRNVVVDVCKAMAEWRMTPAKEAE